MDVSSEHGRVLPCLGCLPVSRIPDARVALGIGRPGLQTLIDDGTLVRLSRLVVVGACLVERAVEDPDFRQDLRIRRLLLEYDDAAASHESAAALLGLPLLEPPRLAIGTRPAGAWRGGDWSRMRIAPLPEHHLTTVAGVRTTCLARTVVDIARSASTRAAVVTGDAALRAGLDRVTLLHMLDETGAWSDLGKPRRALALLDGRSESPLESVSRVVMRECDISPPEPQVWLTGADGSSYRADFYWRQSRVVGEADGMGKYETPRALRDEKLRQEMLERAGYTVVRWTWREMLHETATTMARLTHALRG
jgi:hypothetical protein